MNEKSKITNCDLKKDTMKLKDDFSTMLEYYFAELNYRPLNTLAVRVWQLNFKKWMKIKDHKL